MREIQASVNQDIYDRVEAIALSRGERIGTTGSWIWRDGYRVLEFLTGGWRNYPNGKEILALCPDFEDIPVGVVRLSFRVCAADLVGARLLAIDQRKSPAQIHRNALGIGLWLCCG